MAYKSFYLIKARWVQMLEGLGTTSIMAVVLLVISLTLSLPAIFLLGHTHPQLYSLHECLEPYYRGKQEFTGGGLKKKLQDEQKLGEGTSWQGKSLAAFLLPLFPK